MDYHGCAEIVMNLFCCFDDEEVDYLCVDILYKLGKF